MDVGDARDGGPRVFLSYRRNDSKHLAGRLSDRLAQVVGAGRLFVDVATIRPGSDYRTAITSAVAGREVLIALVGPGWQGLRPDGRRRIDDPDDLVAYEIGTALRRGVPVVPVLADGASPLLADELPDVIRELARLHAIRIDYESFETDILPLLEFVTELARRDPEPEPEPPPSPALQADEPDRPPARPGRRRLAAAAAVLAGLGLLAGGVAAATSWTPSAQSANTPAPGELDQLASGQSADTSQAASACQTGAQANTELDCEVVAVVNSLDGYWADAFSRSGQTYRPPRTNFFSGGVDTGCGPVTSAAGPLYCPTDNELYVDLSFFRELETRFGAQGGAFSRAYVIAHLYGHHVQALLGTSERVQPGDVGPTSGSVRLELQADCYAGIWANHATQVPSASGEPLIVDVGQADVAAALDTASRLGDDFVQSRIGSGQVDRSAFTHGSSAQREKWWTVGYQNGDPAGCDTFARGVELG